MKAIRVVLVSFFVFWPGLGNCDVTGIAVARNNGIASAASSGDNLKFSFLTPTTGNGFDSIFISSLKLFTYNTANYTNAIIAKLYDSDGTTQLGSNADLSYNFANANNSFVFDSSNFGAISLSLSKKYYLHITNIDVSLGGKYTSFSDPLITPTSFGTPGSFFTDPTVESTELNLANLGFELTATISVPEISTFILTSIGIVAFIFFHIFVRSKYNKRIQK